jgi:hypothetical protein
VTEPPVMVVELVFPVIYNELPCGDRGTLPLYAWHKGAAHACGVGTVRCPATQTLDA